MTGLPLKRTPCPRNAMCFAAGRGNAEMQLGKGSVLCQIVGDGSSESQSDAPAARWRLHALSSREISTAVIPPQPPSPSATFQGYLSRLTAAGRAAASPARRASRRVFYFPRGLREQGQGAHATMVHRQLSSRSVRTPCLGPSSAVKLCRPRFPSLAWSCLIPRRL